VRTVVVAELALVTEVHHALHVRGRQPLRLAVDLLAVERAHQVLEGGTERQAAAAPVANVEDPAELTVQGGTFPELGRPDVERAHDETRPDRAPLPQVGGRGVSSPGRPTVG